MPPPDPHFQPKPPAATRPEGWAAWGLRAALRIAVVVAFVWAVRALLLWLTAETAAPDALANLAPSLLVVILLAYAVLIAVPFVPGVEIGLVLLAVEGARVAPLVYAATVLGLIIAYAAGWLLPYATLQRLARDLRLGRIADWIGAMAPLKPQKRVDILAERLPARLRFLARGHRYVLLGLLVNLPGSSLIGGGGGLSLVAGLSRLYRPLPTLLTFALAVAPLPIAVWFFDIPWAPPGV